MVPKFGASWTSTLKACAASSSSPPLNRLQCSIHSELIVIAINYNHVLGRMQGTSPVVEVLLHARCGLGNILYSVGFDVRLVATAIY